MKYEGSPFWQYVKAEDYATCDLCLVTQPLSAFDVGRVGPHELHHCKDVGFCRRARQERLEREAAK